MYIRLDQVNIDRAAVDIIDNYPIMFDVTTHKRLKIYNTVLINRLYKLANHEKYYYGLCNDLLHKLEPIHIETIDGSLSKLHKIFIELSYVKPLITKSNDYWWKLNDYQSRILVLTDMIEIVKRVIELEK